MADELKDQPQAETLTEDQAKWLESQPEWVKKSLEGIELTRVQGLKSAAAARKKELAETTKRLKEIEAKAATEKVATETDLAKRGEFERLATERGAELEALRQAEASHKAAIAAMSEKTSAYEKLIEQMVDSRVKELNPPAYVIDLLAPLSPTEKLAFLDKHQQEFSKGTPNGLPPNNKGAVDDKLTREQRLERTASVRMK